MTRNAVTTKMGTQTSPPGKSAPSDFRRLWVFGGGVALSGAWNGCRARKVVVDELDGHRPFAHSGCAALRRAGADVARGENAGHAGLEDGVCAGGIAGEDEAVFGPCDGVVEPVGARLRTEEQKEEGERQAIAIVECDRLDLTVCSVA